MQRYVVNSPASPNVHQQCASGAGSVGIRARSGRRTPIRRRNFLGWTLCEAQISGAFPQREANRRSIDGARKAQTGQGAVRLHSEEYLTSSDRGIVMLRRSVRAQIGRVMAGEDPVGVLFDPR